VGFQSCRVVTLVNGVSVCLVKNYSYFRGKGERHITATLHTFVVFDYLSSEKRSPKCVCVCVLSVFTIRLFFLFFRKTKRNINLCR